MFIPFEVKERYVITTIRAGYTNIIKTNYSKVSFDKNLYYQSLFSKGGLTHMQKAEKCAIFTSRMNFLNECFLFSRK